MKSVGAVIKDQNGLHWVIVGRHANINVSIRSTEVVLTNKIPRLVFGTYQITIPTEALKFYRPIIND